MDAKPTGMLIKKMACHEKPSTRAPPMMGPKAMPIIDRQMINSVTDPAKYAPRLAPEKKISPPTYNARWLNRSPMVPISSIRPVKVIR